MVFLLLHTYHRSQLLLLCTESLVSIRFSFFFSFSYFTKFKQFAGGIGFGMIYTAATISVGYYFEKYRALATGIAVCGSSIGGLSLSPLFAHIVVSEGWQKTMRIQSYLMFICMLASLAYRPLKPTTRVPLTEEIISEIV